MTPTAASPSDLRGRVFRLAWPIILEMLLQTALGVVDTIMVGRLGADALAGIGTAQQFVFFIIAILSAVTIGSAIMVAQAIGAGDGATASRLAKQSLVWSAIISIPLAVIGLLFSDALMAPFGVSGEVAAIGSGYLAITMGTAILMVLPFTAGAVLRGAGDSQTPLKAAIWANVVNVIVAGVLIFGWLGVPAMGAIGSAWGAAAGRLVSAAILLWVLWRGRGILSIRGLAGWMIETPIARRIIGLGAPAAIEQIAMSAAFIVLVIAIAHLGTAALAAQRIAGMALTLSLMPGFGFAIAATALVGQSIGARRPAEGIAAANVATRWAVIWMSAVGAGYILFSGLITSAFTDDMAVRELAAASLLPVGFVQPVWAIGIVLSGALRGSGNTRFPMIMTIILGWGNTLVAMIATGPLGLGLPYAWAGFLLISPLTTYLTYRRFRRGDWQAAAIPDGQPAARVAVASVGEH